MIPLEEHPNFDEDINFHEETQETYRNRTALDKERVENALILIMTTSIKNDLNYRRQIFKAFSFNRTNCNI